MKLKHEPMDMPPDEPDKCIGDMDDDCPLCQVVTMYWDLDKEQRQFLKEYVNERT